jgi:hypothetical protein
MNSQRAKVHAQQINPNLIARLGFNFSFQAFYGSRRTGRPPFVFRAHNDV